MRHLSLTTSATALVALLTLVCAVALTAPPAIAPASTRPATGPAEVPDYNITEVERHAVALGAQFRIQWSLPGLAGAMVDGDSVRFVGQEGQWLRFRGVAEGVATIHISSQPDATFRATCKAEVIDPAAQAAALAKLAEPVRGFLSESAAAIALKPTTIEVYRLDAGDQDTAPRVPNFKGPAGTRFYGYRALATLRLEEPAKIAPVKDWLLADDLLAPQPRQELDDQTRQEVARLLKDLASTDFKTRERASMRLTEIGPVTKGLLEQAANDSTDPEVANRIAGVLALWTLAAKEMSPLLGLRFSRLARRFDLLIDPAGGKVHIVAQVPDPAAAGGSATHDQVRKLSPQSRAKVLDLAKGWFPDDKELAKVK